jgi:hypothetical protein
MFKIRTIPAVVLTTLLLLTVACAPPEEQATTPEKSAPEETAIVQTPAEEPPATGTPKEAIITDNKPAEAEIPAGGEVIRLYYYGPSALGVDPAGLPGDHSIYSATSGNGLDFKEDPGVRFSHNTGSGFGITDADVVRLNNGSWLMFLSLGTQLLKATSPDSLGTFTLDSSFSWNQGGVPGSFNFNGTVRTFVCNQGAIQMATYNQDSGKLTYSRIALQAPASGLIADPSVIQVGDSYIMFYKYAASPATPPDQHQIFMATSPDGTEWTQHAQNRFICTGSVPGAVYYNGTIYVYYCGLKPVPGSPGGDLGVAVSRDNGATFTTSAIRIEGRTARGVVDPSVTVISPGK